MQVGLRHYVTKLCIIIFGSTFQGVFYWKKEKSSADYDTDDSDGDDEHVSLFRNNFPVNSYFVFHSVDDVNRYLLFIFLSLT